MSKYSLTQLQEIIDISNRTDLASAMSLFRTRADSQSEFTALGSAYTTLLTHFERVRTIMGGARDCDFGDTTPEGLMEYITDRANAATTALDAANAAENFTEPSDGSQAHELRWYGSGSGS